MSKKIKCAIITENLYDADRVYTDEIRNKLKADYDICGSVITRKNITEHTDFLKDAEFLFSTWGMDRFSEEEIKYYFPNLKCLFYSAGSVQHFAREFLSLSVRVFSAWRANAVPVADYVHSQILLAGKGFFGSQKLLKSSSWEISRQYASHFTGNYKLKVGIIGVGEIGSAVAEKLKTNSVDVFYYDPFLSNEKAKKLNIQKASLEEIFSNCDVITNHLANKDELTGILSEELFGIMKPYAVFINTGRGRQVDEHGLIKAMQSVPTRTALLDVVCEEPVSKNNPLLLCDNIILTPHIAGSSGREVERMAEYMLEEAKRVTANEGTKHEVTIEMLKTMA